MEALGIATRTLSDSPTSMGVGEVGVDLGAKCDERQSGTVSVNEGGKGKGAGADDADVDFEDTVCG